MKGDYKIPWDKAGQPMSYEHGQFEIDGNGGYNRFGPEWRDNKPFNASLCYDGYGRGRSSAVIYFKDMKGTRYSVFMSDFDKIAPLMVGGVIEGTFEFVKKGSNYGLQLMEA